MKKGGIKETAIQLVKYGLIGISNTLLTLIAFYICNTLCGLSYTISNTVGYILGLVNSFIWNRTWVFHTNGSLLKELSLFVVGFLICFALQLGISHWLLSTSIADIEFDFLPMKNTGENIVMCLSMVVYTLANYTFNRLVTFKTKSTVK